MIIKLHKSKANERRVLPHNYPAPNRFLKIDSNGHIMYSMR
jgi:hypothetical protein